jgi:hypothetical protein
VLVDAFAINCLHIFFRKYDPEISELIGGYSYLDL